MQKSITIHIPGLAVAKGRPRLARNGCTYTPEKTRSYEAKIKAYAQEVMTREMGGKLLSGPIEADIGIAMPVPSSLSAKKRAGLIGKPHTSRPDADNIVKAVLDGLNLIAYSDDAMVWRQSVRKVYAEHPGVTVMLTGEVAL